MIETILLLARKGIGMGVLGGVAFAGAGAAKDGYDAIKNVLLVNATNIEIEGAHKVLYGVYVRDSRYPQGKEELWRVLQENYEEDQLPHVKTDAWYTSYYWLTPDYEIRSAGPDKKHETRDDFGKRYPKLVKR